MSANGKKWSQFAEATSLVDGDKVLVRDVSEAAADQVKEMTKANLSETLGVAGHLSDPTLHMTKADINDRHLNKAPSNAIVGDGVDDYVSLNSSLLQFGDSLSDISCGESAIIEIDDLGSIFVISAKATGSAPNNERTFTVKTDGKLEIKLFDSSTAVYIGQTGSTVLVVGRRYHVVWTYDGSGTSAGIKLYVNGVAETLTLTELGSYTAMHASGASAYLFRFSANYGKGKIYSYVPWNRELSAADVALLAANGNQPEPSDQWGGATATSGTLTVGQRYRITTFVAGDDFSNVGAGSHATGVEFVATGTTPTTWTNSSTLTEIGAIASIQGRNLESDSAVDESTNEINGTLLGGATRLFEPKAQARGTFTPTLYFGASAQTTTVNSGHWWKDSNNPDLIFFTIRISSPAAVSDAGNVIIDGLPFNSVNDAGKRFTPTVWPQNLTGMTGVVIALVENNGDSIIIYQTTATGNTPLTNSYCTTSSVFTVTGFYEIA